MAKANFEEKDFEDFQSYFESLDDSVLVVLRAHLYTEAMIDRAIAAELPHGERITEDGAFSYARKLTILSGLDLVEENTLAALRSLNKLRNRCAHELCGVISEKDLEPLWRQFPQFFREAKEKARKEGGDIVMAMLAYLCGRIAGTARAAEEKRAKKARRKRKSAV